MENNDTILKNNQIYSQVYSILNLIGDNYKRKIPNTLLKFIDKKRDKSYIPQYNLNTSFTKQKIDKMALSIIYIIDLRYWCSEKEKTKLMKKLNNN